MRHTYLVCYDISDDVRRSRVLKTMKGFGDHLQYSVFECQLNATDLARCRHALSQAIHHNNDQGAVRSHRQSVMPVPACAFTPIALALSRESRGHAVSTLPSSERRSPAAAPRRTDWCSWPLTSRDAPTAATPD